MIQKERCPNLNHSRSNAPVRHCPACGDVVNENIAPEKCSKEKHAKSRLDRNRFCVDCDEQLIQGR
ncbi:MAG TPA: hypothetical protein ENH52_10560 [Nitrospirae bacterium]|nr:hypothetical protein [Nitrospirota bacterium]